MCRCPQAPASDVSASSWGLCAQLCAEHAGGTIGQNSPPLPPPQGHQVPYVRSRVSSPHQLTLLPQPPIRTFPCSLSTEVAPTRRTAQLIHQDNFASWSPLNGSESWVKAHTVCQGCSGLLHLLLGLVPLQDHATALLRGRHDPPLRLLLLARQGCHFSAFESWFFVWA